jgi:hypothetical protein
MARVGYCWRVSCSGCWYVYIIAKHSLIPTLDKNRFTDSQESHSSRSGTLWRLDNRICRWNLERRKWALWSCRRGSWFNKSSVCLVTGSQKRLINLLGIIHSWNYYFCGIAWRKTFTIVCLQCWLWSNQGSSYCTQCEQEISFNLQPNPPKKISITVFGLLWLEAFLGIRWRIIGLLDWIRIATPDPEDLDWYDCPVVSIAIWRSELIWETGNRWRWRPEIIETNG